MVRVEVDDDAWKVHKKSRPPMGVRTEEKLIACLEDDLWERSLSVIEHSEKHLIGDTPEAYAQREIRFEKERKRQTANSKPSQTACACPKTLFS